MSRSALAAYSFVMQMLAHLAFAALLTALGAALGISQAPLYNAPAQAPLEPAPLATSTGASYNWSGYVAEGGVYSAVSGTWVVPQSAPHPGAELSADATWVGIGGVESDDLIQAGTHAIVEQDGTVSHAAWYELLPAPSRTVPLRVRPGDEVTAAVTYLGGHRWQILLLNNTLGERYATIVPYRSSFSSAEWVQEMPSLAPKRGPRARGLTEPGFIPLTDFGAVSFMSGFAVKDGGSVSIAGAQAAPLRMVNGMGETLAIPTALLRDGGFSVLRTDALASLPRAILARLGDLRQPSF